jgi:hypothetical protein
MDAPALLVEHDDIAPDRITSLILSPRGAQGMDSLHKLGIAPFGCQRHNAKM